MEDKIYYYSDPLNDDFAGTDIKTETVGDDYKYIDKNIFFRIGTFFVYRVIAKPLVSLYVRLWHRQRFVNRRAIKKVGKSGAFVYGNHTLIPEDAFIPNMLTRTKYNYVIAGADAVSIKGLKTIVRMFGVIPVPSSNSIFKKYLDCIEKRVNHGSLITIYPEAHIWPYYTGIRPFKSVSFHYPVELDKPVFALTNTFHKSKHCKRPYVVTYIDGPFYPDKSLPQKEAMQKLRDAVYEKMVERSKTSDQEYIKYVYVPKEQ